MSFDFDKPLIGQHLIEASAGTGKTHLLTTLYLRLILGRGTHEQRAYEVSEVLVVTFTIAAAKELKNRIRQRLKAAIDAIATGNSDDTEIKHLFEHQASGATQLDLQRLKQALLSFDEAAIHTIHGFCARVLKDASFAAGTLFDQSLDAHPKEILTSAAQDVFRNFLAVSSPLEEALTLSIWTTPDALAQSLGPLLKLPELRYCPEPATDGFPDDLIDSMRAVKTQWIDANIAELLKASPLKKTSKAWHRIDQMQSFCTTSALAPDSELWHIWSKSALNQAMRKGEISPQHLIFDDLERIAAALRGRGPIISRIWQTTLAQLRSRVVAQRAAGRLTVDDLLTVLRDAVTTAPGLALGLNVAYPAILVDEFQDTDHEQYDIFRGIHAAADPHLLLLIGDPKQSIYRFRGADIFTYLDAKDQSRHTHQLDTNWRATQPLVQAINHLFDQSGCFTEDNSIGFFPSFAAKPFEPEALTLNGESTPPFWFVGDDPSFSKRSQQVDNDQLAKHFAHQIELWLSEQSTLLIEGKPIAAKQIAVLTRNRSQADLINRALNQRGLSAVYLTQDNVLEQNTAKDVVLVLQAILSPVNDQKILSALATELLQSTRHELEQFKTSEIEQLKVKAEFQHFDQIWRQRGIAACILSLLKTRRLATRWLSQTQGARQLTNLRHLAELLEAQSNKLPGRAQLISWLTQDYQHDEALIDDVRQLRLDSDDNLIKIMTLHGAKGLEFDIVCLPFAHFSSDASRRKSEPSVSHQRNANAVIEPWINLEEDPRLTALAEQEASEEDMRLLYVALTRAKYLNVVGLGCPNRSASSTASRLLGLSESDNPSEVLQNLPSTLFRAQFGPVEAHSRLTLTDASESETWLTPHEKPFITIDWRLHSYTRLVKTELRGAQIDATTRGFSDDDITPIDAKSDASSAGERLEDLHYYVTQVFPAGPQVGIAMHQLLENLEFQKPIFLQRGMIDRLCQRLKLSAQSAEPIESWLEAIISHPLTPSALRLQDVSRGDRVDELEFHFPVHRASTFIAAAHDLGFLERIEDVPLNLEGMMTGSIDLVCRNAGRYYLMDYKTNHLGNSPEHYSASQLEKVMAHHHYDLQYLIYAVALKKLLVLREPDFAFDRHFGGVAYLFLRGMQGFGEQGVYFRSLPEDAITRLEHALGGTG